MDFQQTLCVGGISNPIDFGFRRIVSGRILPQSEHTLHLMETLKRLEALVNHSDNIIKTRDPRGCDGGEREREERSEDQGDGIDLERDPGREPRPRGTDRDSPGKVDDGHDEHAEYDIHDGPHMSQPDSPRCFNKSATRILAFS